MKIIYKTLKKNHNLSQESDSSLFLRYVWFFLFLTGWFYAFFFLLAVGATYLIPIEKELSLFSGEYSVFSEIAQELPTELKSRYSDWPYSISLIDMDDTQNAFSTLGWNVFLTQAFLEQVETYEELDFIVWHEFGHILHRDVMKTLVSRIPVTLILSLFSGDSGLILFEATIGNSHSKFQESSADKYALDYVYKKNGHIGCALDFFEKTNTMGDNIMEIFSTHPVTQFRIQKLQKYAKKKWYISKKCKPFHISQN